MHQSKFGHVATAAAFESGEIIRAPLYFQLFEFVGADAVFSDFANYGVERFECRVARIFRLVHNACGHLRRAVVTEEVINAAAGINGNLLFKN